MELVVLWLLRAAWIAGILPILVASIPISRFSSFHQLLLGFAGRGKTMQSSSQKFTVPQKYFCHFYVLGLTWTTILLATTWIYAYKMTRFDLSDQFMGTLRVWEAVFLLLLMEVQVLRRLIESFFVFKYSPSARMHILGYLTGIFFYTAGPLSLCCNIAPEVARFAGTQAVEFFAKDKSQWSVFELDWWGYANPLMKLGWLQRIGAVIFVWGWIHQYRCHAILGKLRETTNQRNKYVIPSGDWFEIVSCPHYLAEIVIYFGLVIASGGANLTTWLLNLFTVANLAFAAAETHRWYLSKFENYPSNRKAIFPYVY